MNVNKIEQSYWDALATMHPEYVEYLIRFAEKVFFIALVFLAFACSRSKTYTVVQAGYNIENEITFTDDYVIFGENVYDVDSVRGNTYFCGQTDFMILDKKNIEVSHPNGERTICELHIHTS